jgi:hypothetical protein
MVVRPSDLVCSMPVTIIDSLPKSASPLLVPMRHGQLFLGTIDLYYSVLILAHSFGFVEVRYVLLSCYSLIISSVYVNLFLL